MIEQQKTIPGRAKQGPGSSAKNLMGQRWAIHTSHIFALYSVCFLFLGSSPKHSDTVTESGCRGGGLPGRDCRLQTHEGEYCG